MIVLQPVGQPFFELQSICIIDCFLPKLRSLTYLCCMLLPSSLAQFFPLLYHGPDAGRFSPGCWQDLQCWLMSVWDWALLQLHAACFSARPLFG